jgi:hypothetical protein
MTQNIDTINAAVAIIIKAAVLAAMFSGRVRKRSLKRLSKMDIDAKDKDKEMLFFVTKITNLNFRYQFFKKAYKRNPTPNHIQSVKNYSSSTIWKHFRYPGAESLSTWAFFTSYSPATGT